MESRFLIAKLEERKKELVKQLAQIQQQAEQLARAAILTRGRIAEIDTILASEELRKAEDDEG